MKGDHAGKYETSMLWALRPDLVRTEKIGTSDDWFTETAKEASLALGEEMIGEIVRYWETVV